VAVVSNVRYLIYCLHVYIYMSCVYSMEELASFDLGLMEEEVMDCTYSFGSIPRQGEEANHHPEEKQLPIVKREKPELTMGRQYPYMELDLDWTEKVLI
jgi:hypothetical protein